MDVEFEVWGVPAGEIPFDPRCLGVYYTQADAETAMLWFQAGKGWTNLHIRQSGQLFRPEGKP